MKKNVVMKIEICENDDEEIEVFVNGKKVEIEENGFGEDSLIVECGELNYEKVKLVLDLMNG